MGSFLLKTFVERAEEFFLEYDQKQFVNIGVTSITDKIAELTLTVKSNYCNETIDQSIQTIDAFALDSATMCQFISDATYSDRFSTFHYMISDVSFKEPSVIYCDKLRTAADALYRTIGRYIKGELKQDKVENLIQTTDSWIMSTKKRSVKTPLDYSCALGSVYTKQAWTPPEVPVTAEYVMDAIIPEIRDFPANKASLISQLRVVGDAISYCVDKCRASLDAVNNFNQTQTDKKRISEMSSIGYNRVRGMMEVLSFVCYVVLNKTHFFLAKLKSIQKFYNALQSQFVEVRSLVECGAFSALSDQEYSELTEDFLNGNTYHFKQISNAVCEMVSNDLPRYSIPTHTYDAVAAVFDTIASCVREMGELAEDNSLSIAEIMDESNMPDSILARYKDTVASICVVESYTTGQSSYNNMLCEIRDFPSYVQRVSTSVQNCMDQIDEAKEKLDSMDSYDSDIDDIKDVLDSSEAEVNDLAALSAKCMYQRLQNLTNCADNYNFAQSDMGCDPDDCPQMQEAVDFTSVCLKESIEILREETDLMMAILTEKYYQARIWKEQGIHLVFEADEGNNGNNNNGQNGNNGNPSKTETKPTVNDGDKIGGGNKHGVNDNGITKGSLSKVIEAIKTFFRNMIDNFKAMINKTKYQNGEWLRTHKEAILTRDYTDITIEILPYADMAPETILANLSKVRDNVRAMRADKAKNIKSRDEMLAALITFDIDYKQNGLDEAVVATNYNKVGKQAMEKRTYANEAVKSLVTDAIIPWCEKYYEDFTNAVSGKIDEISTAMEDSTKSYVSESVSELRNGNLFLEADDQNADANNSGNSGGAEKAKWMRAIVQTYTGAVLNAIRDRQNDYLNVLSSICPKTNEPNAQSKSTENNNNQ